MAAITIPVTLPAPDHVALLAPVVRRCFAGQAVALWRAAGLEVRQVEGQ